MYRRSSRRLLGQLVALAPSVFVLSACGSVGSTGDGVDIGQSLEQLAGVTACPSGYTIIQGTNGNDVIDASAHTESVCILGNGGDDTITGGSNNDAIFGGLGNDTIHGGPGSDTLHGEDGNDIVHGDDGNDLVYGETGTDQLFGDNGNDFLYNNSANDVFFGGAGDDQLNGGPNNDTLHGDDGNDTLFGNDGNDTLEGGNGNDALNGGNGDDHVWGDFINNATTTTGSTVDTLHGNDGNDDLHGGPGNDVIFGDTGTDSLNGDDGDDRLVGGTSGTKTISGGTGNDLAKGNGGSDSLSGNDNNDVLVVAGTSDGGNGTDACGGTSCELPEPPSFCTSVAGQCGIGQRCALEVGVCIFCQSDSECATGQCIPTKGCTNIETVCNDGIDNDGDGKIDCADSDCAQALNCQTGVTYLGDSGVWHDCITNSSGQVKCWGRNNCEQLGYNPPTQSTTFMSLNPTVITNSLASAPLMVRGGSSHTCVLLKSGALQCWGRNNEGELGNGTTTTQCSITPVNVSGITTATQLGSGGNFNCVVLASGAVQCWGQNDHGQLGNGTTTNSSTPVGVQGIGGTAIEVELGIQHACARLTNGSVKCWGRNHVGELGNGTTVDSHTAVTANIGSVSQISAGAEFACARRANGTTFCWGRNNEGQLGIGTSDFNVHPTPTQVSTVLDAVDLGSGWYHTCIRRATQGLRCWGRDDHGQIGNGTVVPLQVVGGCPGGCFGGVTTPAAVGIFDGTQFMMGQIYTCVRRAAGTLSCWGDNQFGEMGDGTTTDRTTPIAVPSVP